MIYNNQYAIPQERTIPREVPQIKVVGNFEEDLGKNRNSYILVFLIAFFLFFIVSLLFINVSIETSQLEVNRKIARNTQLEKSLDDYKVSINKSDNLQNVEQIAKNDLGMVVPNKFQYLHVENLKEVPDNFFEIMKSKAFIE